MLPPLGLDVLLHLDTYLYAVIGQYGLLVYLFLFLVILLETGVVVLAILPGDSLLFVAGALSASGSLDIALLLVTLVVAAIVGDTINYWTGYRLGRKAFNGRIKFLKDEQLKKAERFYEKHGGKAIFIARFIPIIRTFAPFVAGMGKMEYKRFIGYNVAGGVVWVSSFLLAGFYFGNIPVVKENLGMILIAIIVVSLAAAAVGFLRPEKK